jgi:hypothetical protein
VLRARATDLAGNVDPTPATRSWTVDTVAPETTIDSGPFGTVASGDATFTFSASEAGTVYECRFGFGLFEPCTSPRSYSGLGGGLHSFEVRARDAAGNLDATPASRTWLVSLPSDTTPPETTITSGPSGTVTAMTATFAFASNEAGTFECKLDFGLWALCVSPHSYGANVIWLGQHTFSVRATDQSGNVDPTPAERTWTVAAAQPPPPPPPPPAGAPPNDPFANATPISGSTGTVSGTSVGATRETGEPFHYASKGGRSVWYRWTAPASGTVTFDTIGSGFDTLLAAYTGTAVAALTRLASDDDSAGSYRSRITFAATAGTTYSVAVDGPGAKSGSVRLNWSLAVAP